MGLLKIFSGKKPEEFEQKGDSLFESKDYGAAKIEYEAALSKLEKTSPDNRNGRMKAAGFSKNSCKPRTIWQ